MTPEQFGPMGILAVLVGGCVWAGKWMLTRLAKMFDAHEEHAKAINITLNGLAQMLSNHAAREESVLRQHASDLAETRREVVAIREHVTGAVSKITDEVEAIVVVAVKKASTAQPIEPSDLPARRKG